jgi:hypothetical protein
MLVFLAISHLTPEEGAFRTTQRISTNRTVNIDTTIYVGEYHCDDDSSHYYRHAYGPPRCKTEDDPQEKNYHHCYPWTQFFQIAQLQKHVAYLLLHLASKVYQLPGKNFVIIIVH